MPRFLIEHCLTDRSGEVIALAYDTLPTDAQRSGVTGLIQRPDAHNVDLLSAVYGIPFPVVPFEYDPPAGIEPLPEQSDEVSEYLLAFWESARRIACHPRIVDRLQKRSPWFDGEDMPQAAIEYLLSDPARYALEDSHQGARRAVRDILDDLRRGNRTLIDDSLVDRRQKPLNESIPEPQREYIDPDQEAEILISSGIVSPRSAHIAIALASDATREVVAESLGVTRQTVHNLTRKMLAEVIVRGSI